MVNHFFQLKIAEPAIHKDRVPVNLIHMITGLNLIIFFAQQNCPLGITFNIKAIRLVQSAKQKDLTHYLKHKRIFAEWKCFTDMRFA